MSGTSTTVKEYLSAAEQCTLLRFSTAGSVDDGKSTLIGRLLHDSKNIYEDTLRSIEDKSQKKGARTIELAYLTDGLRAEQEQGITIDVAYRYFSTPRRRFVLADSPGHEQYTRNMATGASTADVTIVLIDAQAGVLTQTKRHAFIASLLGVPRLLVAVNKMDLVNFSQAVFEEIRADFIDFSGKLGVQDIRFVPISALEGDNVVEQSAKMPWYHGETVMEYLENVYTHGDQNQVDFRFPVQLVIRPDQNYRGYAGQIKSGTIRVGEEVMALPAMRKSRVKSIDVLGPGGKPKSLPAAFAPMSVALTLEHEIDIPRGDMIVRSHNVPSKVSAFEALVVWMGEAPMDLGRPYIVMHTSRESKAFVDNIDYRIDVNTLSRLPAAPLELNEIGRVSISVTTPLLLDPYNRNRATGNFIIVDPESFLTLGAGMIIDRQPQAGAEVANPAAIGAPVSKNLHREEALITRAEREQQFGSPAQTLWLTGLSGSGKSTIAKNLERRIFRDGTPVYRLDGDNLRGRLNRDLGFSKEDRKENIRRVAEVARLFNNAGVSVICSFISPFTADREMAREIIGAETFIEIFVDTPIEICEQRDPHGLYKKARQGELKEFTGVSAPYERPEKPALTVLPGTQSVEQCVEAIVSAIKR